jgi:DnaJ-class molecular chaperone
MTREERRELIDKLAQKVTDDCPTEALMQHFYNDQYEYFNDMSDSELKAEQKDILDEDEDHTCVACTGTGEGHWDGSSCTNCGGKGEITTNDWDLDERDYDD